MKTKTFKGQSYRVQLLVLDLPEYVSFSVHVLPADSHPYTAFRGRTGKQVYYGRDSEAALRRIRDFCPAAEWPVEWSRFRGKRLMEILT
jgi:hypothetical protein